MADAAAPEENKRREITASKIKRDRILEEIKIREATVIKAKEDATDQILAQNLK